MRKRLLTFTVLLTLLTTGVSFKSFTKVSGLSARSINATNASTATVRNYYSTLNSKPEAERKGYALLASLKPILKNGHSTFNYATVWDWTKVTDRDWDLSPMTQAQLNNYNFADNPYVKLLYRNDNGTATAPKHEDEHGKVIDREHVWPKSLGDFGEKAPAGTDLHHLILADSKNNQQGHSNYPYGNVNPDSYTPIDSFYHADNPTNVGNYTGKRGTITYLGKSFTVYEPQDADKGDIARAMFYMAARYSSHTSATDPYLILTNDGSLVDSSKSGPSTPGYGGLLSTLLEWHEQDPVDDYEIRRNNLIYNNAQFNRNPFIDYPSWVDAVWGSQTAASPANDYVSQFGQTGNIEPTTISVNPNILSLNVGGSQTLSVSVTPANASKSVTWTSTNNSIATVNSSGTVSAVAVGTTTITAKSTLNNAIMGSATITVNTAPTLTSLTVANYETSVKLTDLYNNANMTVTAHYSNGSSANVTSSAIIEEPDTNQLGTQTLTVSYTENGISRFTTYEVKVTNNGVSVGNVSTVATDLFISEYIEGSGDHKYLEIYNGTGKQVDLSDYRLQLFANGASNPNNNVLLEGNLPNNKTIVYKNTKSSLNLPPGVVAIDNTAINFNGNDAVAIYKISEAAFVDIFGIIGNNPGSAWTGGGVSTVNKTLVRKPAVYQGITVNPPTFDPSIEWIQYAEDTASYLGSHTMNATTPGLAKEVQANAWAEYFLDATSLYCEELSGDELAGSLWNEFGAEYAFMDATTKTLYKSTPSNPDSEGISGAKARYLYLITKYGTLNNFMKDENNNPIFSVNTRPEPSSANNQNLVVILTLSIATIFIGLYFYINKKKQLFTN